MAPHGPVTVLLARFEDLVGAGLRSLIGADPSLRIVASDVTADRLSAVIGEHAPRVAIINLVALLTPGDVNRLHRAHPATQLIVLAHAPRRPSAVSSSPSAPPHVSVATSRAATSSRRSTSPPAGCTSCRAARPPRAATTS